MKLKKPSFIPESEFHIKESKKGVQQSNVQNNAQKTETANSKKDIKTETVSNSNYVNKTNLASRERERKDETRIKSRNSVEIIEVNDKKKDIKSDQQTKNESKARKVANDEKVNNNSDKNNRNESRASSTSSLSPRRTNEHRIKEEVTESDKGLIYIFKEFNELIIFFCFQKEIIRREKSIQRFAFLKFLFHLS